MFLTGIFGLVFLWHVSSLMLNVIENEIRL
jgi:hypothetical protein